MPRQRARLHAARFTGAAPEIIGLITAVFMLAFVIEGALLADVINRRTQPVRDVMSVPAR